MHNFYIATNNPMVYAAHPFMARYQSGTVDAVLIAVRDAVHQGAILISHPLAGSLKPYQTPYRSVLLSCAHGAMDMRSLSIIEDALITYRTFPKKAKQDNECILQDYQVIDMDLVRSALASLPAQYF